MKNNRGQIGPFSFEVLFPMVVVLIILALFIALTLTVTMNGLKQRRAETMHETAENIAQLLYSRSVLVYGGHVGLLARNAVDSVTCEELNSQYAMTGYRYSIELIDSDGVTIGSADCPDQKGDVSVVDTPVAIRYSEDDVRTGILKVKVWMK
jgi:Tfp pilus assembly protein FimT